MKENKFKKLFSHRDITLIAFLFIVIIFTAFKSQHLFLPYFWDEAWSYIPAITMMNNTGLSLLPDALPPDISRGHPLLYYFLAASWMRIWGDSVFVMHFFGLTVSLLLLATMYFSGVKIFSPPVAVMAVAAFCLQAVFLAQSVLLLPEVMLTLFSFLAVCFFIIQRRLMYFICALCMLLTKETGLVVIAAIATWHVMNTFLSGSMFSKESIKQLAVIIAPVAAASVFFMVQYLQQGWFFFPEHIHMIDLGMPVIKDKIQFCYQVVFKHQGRWLFSRALLPGLYVYLKKCNLRNGDTGESRRDGFLGIVLCLIVLMLIYSSLNFLTDRYLLCLLPFYLLAGFYLIRQFTGNHTGLFFAISLVCCIPFVLYNSKDYPPSDHDLSYVDGVRVMQDMIQYAEQNNLYRKEIFVSFLYGICMTKPETKYRRTAEQFKRLNFDLNCGNDYFIISNIESNPEFRNFKETCIMKLLVRFRRGKVWADIYRHER